MEKLRLTQEEIDKIIEHLSNRLTKCNNYSKFRFTGGNIKDKSKIEVELFSKDTEPNSVINIVTEKPDNLSTYNKYENYSTKFETKENLNTLTIVLNETTGKNIYPTVKIYKR